MSDTTADGPSPRRPRTGRARWLLPLALVLVVATGAAAALLVGADRERDREREQQQQQAAVDATFREQAAGWRADVLTGVVEDLEQARFGNLVVVGRSETAEEQAAQQQRCGRLVAVQAAVTGLRPPAPPAGASGDARQMGDELAAAVDSYRKAVLAPLSEIISYCGYYTRAIALGRERQAAEDALSAAVTRTGLLERTVAADGSVTTTTCESPDGCIPLTPAARKTYVAAYDKARVDVLGRDYANDGGAKQGCRLSDLAPVCAVAAKRTAALTAGYQAFVDAVAATSEIDDPGVAAAGAKADALAAAFGEAYVAAYAAAFPEVDAKAPGGTLRHELALLAGYERALAAVPPPVA